MFCLSACYVSYFVELGREESLAELLMIWTLSFAMQQHSPLVKYDQSKKHRVTNNGSKDLSIHATNDNVCLHVMFPIL